MNELISQFNKIGNLEERLKAVESALVTLMMKEGKKNEVLSKEEACELAGLTIHSLNEARRKNRITGIKVNAKEYGYRRQDIEAYTKRLYRQQA